MATNEDCTSKQTFCKVGSQTASQWVSNFSYNPATLKDNDITDTVWNSIIDKVVAIYNYGNRGTRNPSTPFGISNFTTPSSTSTTSGESAETGKIADTTRNTKHVADNNTINLSEYNSILSTIGESTLSQSATDLTITAERFNAIATAINSLSFDATRCNNCNVGCNSKCKASSQCNIVCDGSGCSRGACYGCPYGSEAGAPCYCNMNRA